MYGVKENNIRMLTIIADELKELRQQVVFVGGCATALLVTDPATPDIRHTLDVDFIVDVISLREFNRFEERLRKLGFQQPLSGNDPICRWQKDNMLIDVMPTEEKILGFSNRWYKETAKNAKKVKLSNNITIKMASAPYFLATKLEAFKHRGANDFLASHDLEDIITIIDGRPELSKEITQVKQDLRIIMVRLVMKGRTLSMDGSKK
jgi:predicted nucleotidyltransferase